MDTNNQLIQSTDLRILESRWKIENGRIFFPKLSKQDAEEFFTDEVCDRLEIFIRKMKLDGAVVSFPNMKRGFEIWSCLNDNEPSNDAARAELVMALAGNRNDKSTEITEEQEMADFSQIENLLGADYARIHEFLKQQRTEGKIVIITSNITGTCYHTNDLLKPERGVLQPYMWTGYNYLNSWRDTMHQLEHLKELLEQDGFVPQYEYELRRPDNAFCSYSTDYYLCRNYLGDEVRIGVSKPEDWRLLKTT
jgi:hypothetical protein